MSDLFPNNQPEITTDEICAELRREIAMRQLDYPRQMQAGKLSVNQFRHRIRCLELALERIENG